MDIWKLLMHVDFAVHVYDTVSEPSRTTPLVKFVIAQNTLA